MSDSTLSRYQITSTLGQGAMGVVYGAYDPSLDRRVALKELHLPPGLSEDALEDAVSRFYTEARAAGRLSHPNIVTVHEVGEDGGRPFIAMELLDGPTLGEVLDEAGALSPAHAQDVLVQVAEALAHAHAQGVVHRDIKPDNCFWLQDGRVKVADFGIARVGTEAKRTQAGTVLGTPGYMAPEQVRGQEAGFAADVFSWGAMAYECLTGTPPFGSDDPTSVMYRIVHEDPPDLSALAPDAPSSLVTVVARALAKDPHDRYPDAAALVADLSGDTIPIAPPRARRPTPQPRTSSVPPWSPKSRSRLPFSLIAAITAGVLVVGGAVALALTVVNRGEGELVLPPDSAPIEDASPDASPSPSPSPTATKTRSPKSPRFPAGRPKDPRGAYTVIIKTITEPGQGRAEAQALANRAQREGIRAGVLWTGDYSGLACCYWVTYAGSFSTAVAAETERNRIRSLGGPFAGAYFKHAGY